MEKDVLEIWCILYQKGFLTDAINKAMTVKNFSLSEKQKLISACKYAQAHVQSFSVGNTDSITSAASTQIPDNLLTNFISRLNKK